MIAYLHLKLHKNAIAGSVFALNFFIVINPRNPKVVFFTWYKFLSLKKENKCVQRTIFTIIFIFYFNSHQSFTWHATATFLQIYIISGQSNRYGYIDEAVSRRRFEIKQKYCKIAEKEESLIFLFPFSMTGEMSESDIEEKQFLMWY